MNWWDKAKGKTKDTVSDSKLGKAVQGMGKGMQGLKSLHSDVKNGASKVAGGFADVLFKIIKGVFWGLLIVGILFAAAVMLYSAESENCVEFRTPGLQGYSAIFTDFQNYEFTKCVFANLFSNVEIAIQKIDVVDHILNFMDQQVYRATGDYYYANVDDNVEPVGVFIENLKKKSRYYTDEMVSISADIKVKTLGSKVVGKVTCDLEGIPYDQIVPSTGNFSADKDQSTKVVCGWLPYKFKKTDNSK